MRFDIEQAVCILRNTPAVVTSMLMGVPEKWVHQNEGGESWSPFEIVGHLLHGEKTDWIPRARIILDFGVEKPFTPFDRFAQKRDYADKSLGWLLEEFARWRSDNLRALEQMEIKELDLERNGIHPEFGKVTLAQLLAAWVVHDLGHIRQIARVMAKNYKKTIGPWEQYLPIVHEPCK